MDKNIYDTIIIGSGPAGVTAAIYATRFGLKTLVIEEMGVGGQINWTGEIDNYPGFKSITGAELAEKMRDHAEALGAEILYDNVSSYDLEGEIKKLSTDYSGDFYTKSIIICQGAKPRKLNLENEDKFVGRGVSYCALCDGGFYKDKTVAVVGGGNSALEEAILLSKTCKKVYIIHMLNNFQGNQKNIEKVKTIENIEIKMTSEIKNIIGEDKLEKVLVLNSETKLEETLDLDGIFIAIGRVPNTEKLKMLETDKYGYILTDENMKTNINGIYVAGDIRQKNVRQIVTACSDGAIAATSVATYIN